MVIIIYTDGGERTVPGENETEQPDHSTSLGDSITSSTRIRFSVHTRGTPRWPGGSCRLSLRRSAGCVDTGIDPASKEGNMKSRAGALRPSNSISRCSRERPDPRATSGAPTNPLELFLPQVRRGRPARQFLERVSNHLVSHCREIAPFRQARNPGKLQNTVHCNHCTVPAGSGSAAQVSFVALVGGDRELAHMHCSPYSPRLRRPAARDPFC